MLKTTETERSYNYHITVGETTEGRFFAEFSTFRYGAGTSKEVIDAVGAEIIKDFNL